jgi:hypothetical protein
MAIAIELAVVAVAVAFLVVIPEGDLLSPTVVILNGVKAPCISFLLY